MNVLITGGTGFVGSRLTDTLVEEQDHVYILSRGSHYSEHPYIHYIQYDPDHPENEGWMESMPKKIDIIYNLAGASLQKIWTESHKEEILHSRINVTRMLKKWAEQSEIKPGVLVNASAVGYYPTSESTYFDESHTFAPHNFLSYVTASWEIEARKFETLGVRVVTARFGLILDKENGVLPLISLPYKFGAGGKIGSGEQWYSWIHIDDLLNALLFTAAHDEISGPVNLTAPTPNRQKQFSAYLSAVLGKPNFFTTPAFLFSSVIGEQSIMIVKGQYVFPEVLMENDFKFIFPTLDIALDDLFDKETE